MNIMPLTFRGGLHIPDHKENTNTIPIKQADGAPIHIFPLRQHIGALPEPCVNVGDRVFAGQKIASSDAFVSSPIHSSVSGTVTKIEPYLHPSGENVMSIFVENDFKYEPDPNVCPPKDYRSMTPGEITAVIREAGIVGMGGAGFPTHVKLSPPPEKKITHVIVNGAECEPYLTSDHRRMLECPEDVLDGLTIVMKLFSLEDGYIGIEENKPDAIKLLSEKAEGRGIHIKVLKAKYPQGAEKQLIYAITKKRVPSGGLPADVGAIVINTDTVCAIANAFKTGMPLTERIVTVSGDCIQNPCNLKIKLGTPLKNIIEAAGGFSKEPAKLILGGPMMGVAIFSEDIPSIKTTSCILALSEAKVNYNDDSPCIKCGKCVTHCPMHLSPLYLAKYASEGRLDMCEKFHILDCIECGVCSYLCPGFQAPLARIRLAKQQILKNRRKNK